MKLTKQQRDWLRDVKERAERDSKAHYIKDAYKTWESWRLADLCLKLAGVKDK